MTVIQDLAPPPATEIGPRGVSRSESWQRRLPLLPALIYTIVVTQIPFLLTISTNISINLPAESMSSGPSFWL